MNILEKDKSNLLGLVDRELIVADLELSTLEPSAREWHLGYWRALDLVERDITSYRIGNPREYLAQAEARARDARDAIDPEETTTAAFSYEYADGYHRALIRLKAKLNAFGGN
jgi:hypothetical protein